MKKQSKGQERRGLFSWIKRCRQCLRSKRFKKIFYRTLGTILLFQSTLVTIAFIHNHFFMTTDQYAAVLVSDDFITPYDYWVSPACFFAASPSWTHYFNNRVQRIQWSFRAESGDLIQAIRDPNCQSIVLIGHGTYHSWGAMDKTVTNENIEPYIPYHKKTGEWFQLTCARDDGYGCRMGELIMEPENVYSYHRKVNSLGMIVDAFTAFRYMKSLEPPEPEAN